MLVSSLNTAFRQALFMTLVRPALSRFLLQLLHVKLSSDTGIALPQNGKCIIQSLHPSRVLGVDRFVVGTLCGG